MARGHVGVDDFALSRVPDSARYSWWSVATQRFGQISALSQFLLGSTLGFGMHFWGDGHRTGRPGDRGAPLPDARDGPGPFHRRIGWPTPSRAEGGVCGTCDVPNQRRNGGSQGDERDEAVLKIKAGERTAEAKIARAVAGSDLT